MSDALPQRWLSVKDAAQRIGLDTATIYRLCDARKIRHRRLGMTGGRIVFDESDIAAYLASCVVEVNAPAETDDDPVRLKHVRIPGRRQASGA